MAFYGADVDQLKALSKSLAHGASMLTARARELDSLITRSGYWQGQDAQRFAAEWRGSLRPMLDLVSRGIDEASKSARGNAEEQSGASTEASVGCGSGGSGTIQWAATNTDPGRPSPQEILEEYQVSDAETTNWPGDWDPLKFVVDQRVVTEKEAEMLNGLGPFELNAFKGIHDDAFNVADERFPSADQNDDQNDAFRHAYWNALMVKEFGAEWAEDYATAHEQLPGNPAPREAMDLYNNEVGRESRTTS
jgi:hypothetical protein